MTNKNYTKQLKRGIALTILLLSLCLKTASAQGPNAPEAASFEPVDATDMVNLVTGDLSYVLPLLNVPSPEGGYPISLSYHAGIAADQEASWVGLGWSLNPGAINRAVNGYPDDWGKTNINEFFYDAGWDENYYEFSAGVSFKGGVSVGLGLSWGSNQSLGGYVSASIGPGWDSETGPSIGGRIGTNGASINASIGQFSGSISTSGVGLGYGFSGGNDTSIGINLNYSFNSGLSGGISVSKRNGKFSKGILDGYSKVSSLGINFSSQGISVNGKINGVGAGVSSSSYGISGSDYDIQVSSSGFSIPAYIFYISFNHTKVKYSLFKYNNLYTSGMLNPVSANELKPYNNSTNLSRWLNANHFMDVNSVQRFGENSLYDDLIDDANKNDRNNLVLPNYDNYSVNAQGLSGTISPYIHSELNLSGRGRGEQNDDGEYVHFLNHSLTEYENPTVSVLNGSGLPNEDAVKRIHFTFSNVYNSFLRLERSNIEQQSGLPSVSSDHIMSYFKTNQSSNFSNTNSLTNGIEPRKREGNFIRTFTNKEIRDSYSSGNVSTITNFVDAKQFDAQNNEINLDRSDTAVFLDDGIGAYQITTADGRTYHYSLPVYNYESFYKNFEDANDEDDNFFEIQKTRPYASHWLLTAITGPDFVDINSNGKPDESDYGYWIAFDYGKWSDGYIWQTPNGRFEENIDKDDATKKTYSYAWGRKQVYYLDAIRTRTHSALFIKDIRNDFKSSNNLNLYNQQWTSGIFSLNTYGEDYVEDTSKNYIVTPNFTFYANNGNQFSYSSTQIIPAKRGISKYLYSPINYGLRLKKIILLKNKEINFSKRDGNITNTLNGGTATSHYIKHSITGTKHYYNNPTILKQFDVHQHQNILDIKDIDGLNLEAKAQQIISFDYDYSLAKNSPNSDDSNNGRLTLKSVQYLGKGGIGLVPPYEFEYKSSGVSYNKDLIDDWGYFTNQPDVWSLGTVKTPTGGNIRINYEKDMYGAEAAHAKEEPFNNLVSVLEPNNVTRITFKSGSPNATNYFVVNRFCRLTYTHFNWNINHGGPGTFNSTKFNERYKVLAVGTNWITLEGNIFNYDSANACTPQPGVNCNAGLIVYGNSDNFSQDKSGGGIRTKEIIVSNGVSDIIKTEYQYENGITSYAPTKEQKGVPYVSELPPPMVTYGKVKMINKDGNDLVLGSTEYEFETLEPRKEEAGYIFSLGDCFRVKENQDATMENNSIIVNKYTIESRLGNLGRIKSITSYNNKDHILHKKQNYYKEDLDTDGEIGVTQESHKSYKRLFKNNVEKFYVSSTSKIDYPNVLESTTTTQGGYSAITYFNKHDFLTGQLLETTTVDSKGYEFKTELIPAYTISEYNPNSGYGMGSKVDDPTNYNMLTQEAMTKTYLKVNGNWEETGVGITTWNNDWTYTGFDGTTGSPTADNEKIWRKHKTFVWDGNLNPDGTLNGFTGDDDSFVWDLGQSQTNTEWKNAATTTKYDHYSMPLESKDINDNYASTKTCDEESKVLAVCNAGYNEMYYSGAEYYVPESSYLYFDGQVRTANGRTNTKAHTGNYSVSTSSGIPSFMVTLKNGEHRSGKYKVSVWVEKTNHANARININGSTKSFNGEEIFAGDWVLKNHYEDLSSSEEIVYITSSGSTIYVDDFRLHPVASSMTSYVYNEWDELWCIIGSNGLASKFEYDEAGRLEKTYTEVVDDTNVTGGFKLISENNYNYKHLNQ